MRTAMLSISCMAFIFYRAARFNFYAFASCFLPLSSSLASQNRTKLPISGLAVARSCSASSLRAFSTQKELRSELRRITSHASMCCFRVLGFASLGPEALDISHRELSVCVVVRSQRRRCASDLVRYPEPNFWLEREIRNLRAKSRLIPRCREAAALPSGCASASEQHMSGQLADSLCRSKTEGFMNAYMDNTHSAQYFLGKSSAHSRKNVSTITRAQSYST